MPDGVAHSHHVLLRGELLADYTLDLLGYVGRYLSVLSFKNGAIIIVVFVVPQVVP